VISFSGTIDGESFAGGSAEDYRLELGSKSFIGNFEEQIIGRSAGEEFEVKTTFPENYHKSSLAKKLVLFKVKLSEVLRPERRTLDDEFVKSTFGVEDTTKFREIVAAELAKTYQKLSINYLRAKIIEHLRKNNAFDLPRGLVENRFNSLLRSKKIENVRNSDATEIDTKPLMTEAENIVRIGLLLSKVGEENNIAVSDSELTQAIMQEAVGAPGQEKAVIEYYKNNREALEYIKNGVLENKIMDFMVENAEKNDINITLEEFRSRVGE
jgi:trigger factor